MGVPVDDRKNGFSNTGEKNRRLVFYFFFIGVSGCPSVLINPGLEGVCVCTVSVSACPPQMDARCSSAGALKVVTGWLFVATPTSSTCVGRLSGVRRFVFTAAGAGTQVKRRFRLARSTDIRRVRHSGRSYAHQLLVLYVLMTELPGVHVCVSAGSGLGNAVKRNRAKRLLRAAMSAMIPLLVPGCELLLVGRPPLVSSTFNEVSEALYLLLKRAALLSENHVV
jgi:ribonuclease P protein component